MKALICGTGEYTTGFVHDSSSKSDKQMGVVCLVLMDLIRRNLYISEIGLCGRDPSKFPNILSHLNNTICQLYRNMEPPSITFPKGNSIDNFAYVDAIENWCKTGDVVLIFTPDDTHFEIASLAIRKGCHVLLTKPSVMTISAQRELQKLSKEFNVLCQIEFHKRFDPMYADAIYKSSILGDFNHFISHMSQPKFQLETFGKWAGKSSDISYYLNSHHIDIHCVMMSKLGYNPIRCCSVGSIGIATDVLNIDKVHDTITILCEWKKRDKIGTAVYTASWGAPNGGETHSQQRFFYLSNFGEIRINQGDRNYSLTTDDKYSNVNPIYMKYSPDEEGNFNGQNGYGYISIEKFMKNAEFLNSGEVDNISHFDNLVPTIFSTENVTAILECGRLSLENHGKWIDIEKHLKDPLCHGRISFWQDHYV